MSCIVGLVHGDRVYMGCDSAAASQWDLAVRKDRKVEHVVAEDGSAYLIGFTTSFRMGQLLHFGNWAPDLPLNLGEPHSADLFRFMCGPFVDAARARLGAGGFTKKENEREEGGDFLVGVASGRGPRLFHVSSDFAVGETACGYAATGCGQAAALGSLFTSGEDVDWEPEARVNAALRAAEAFNNGVRGPMHVRWI